MMKLFKKNGYEIEVSDEAMLLKPFRKLVDKDTSDGKIKSKLELDYIFMFCDPRSDFQYITDENVRSENIKQALGFSKNWKPSKDLQKAMEFYNSFVPVSALLLEDSRIAVNKLRILLKNIDLDARDEKNKPIYNLNTIPSTIKQIPDLVESLDRAERTINKEMITNNNVRGSQEKSIYEDL